MEILDLPNATERIIAADPKFDVLVGLVLAIGGATIVYFRYVFTHQFDRQFSKPMFYPIMFVIALGNFGFWYIADTLNRFRLDEFTDYQKEPIPIWLDGRFCGADATICQQISGENRFAIIVLMTFWAFFLLITYIYRRTLT